VYTLPAPERHEWPGEEEIRRQMTELTAEKLERDAEAEREKEERRMEREAEAERNLKAWEETHLAREAEVQRAVEEATSQTREMYRRGLFRPRVAQQSRPGYSQLGGETTSMQYEGAERDLDAALARQKRVVEDPGQQPVIPY
jgi:hypothetical protein